MIITHNFTYTRWSALKMNEVTFYMQYHVTCSSLSYAIQVMHINININIGSIELK